MNITKFFKEDVCNYASYDNYRKIASIVDGLKPSSRKCLYTVLKNNVSSPKKVAVLKSDAASQTQYLHGDQSLEGVIVSMAQDFIGANNIPLLKREGTFGNRLVPVPAAGRYIFTCKEDYLDFIFKKDDEYVLIEQDFEGEKIEPKFYVPVIPLLAVNGNIGLSTGFMQKILPRNPKDIIKYIEAKLNKEKKLPKLEPWFNGFKGIVKKNNDAEGSWIVKGRYKVISGNEIEIYELPSTYTLEDYNDILSRLEDQKKIKEFRDLSDNGEFKFRVKFFRGSDDVIPKADDEESILDMLKLNVSITENYTSMDENNKIVQYSSIYEIVDHYYDVRLSFYKLRKQWKIDDLTKKLREAVSKCIFISSVIDGSIVIAKKTEADIVKQIEKNEKIIKVNNSYDYLVNMPIRTMSKEQVQKLKEQAKALKEQLDDMKSKTEEMLWQQDLDEFKKEYFK